MNFIHMLPESIQTGLLPSLVAVDIIILGLYSVKLALTVSNLERNLMLPSINGYIGFFPFFV